MRLYLSRSMFLTVQKLDFQFLVSGMVSKTGLQLVFAAACSCSCVAIPPLPECSCRLQSQP